MIIKHFKTLFLSAIFMLANNGTLQAMTQETPVLNEANIVVAATLEKIMEQAAPLLSDEENDKIREMISALLYSNNPLVSEEESKRIDANYLSILTSKKFAKRYLACCRLYLDEDNNFRIEVQKTSEEYLKSLLEFQSFVGTKLIPCCAVGITEWTYAINLREALEKGEDGNKIIAQMITLLISSYWIIMPRNLLEGAIGAIGVWSLIPRGNLTSNYETIKSVGNIYYGLFQNLANACYGYYYGEA